MNFTLHICVIFSLMAVLQLAATQDNQVLTLMAVLHRNNSICKSQYNGAILPHPTDCQKFYICVKQKAYEYNCDPDYHYDTNTRSCVAGSTCSSTPNEPAQCVDGTVRQVQNDCYIFEACINGQFQMINCPPNNYFYVPKGICVPITYDVQFKCSCLMPEHAILENINNCETYYICQKKNAILINCPLGQYYNSTINACIPDLEGVCLMKPTITPGIQKQLINTDDKNQNTNTIESSCARLGSEGVQFQLFPKGCNSFYICVNGQLYTQYCANGFYYNSDKMYCVIDETNKCTSIENEANLDIAYLKD